MKTIPCYKPAKIETAETISVVVAVYNIESYIEKCVKSIMAQTYRHLEIILVDDGSLDRSGAICDSLAAMDGRIRVIHKQNGGLSDARNAGIEVAGGSFIAFVDGDDWIEPEMYETMLGAICEFDAQIAVCRYKNRYRDHVEDGSTNQAVVWEGMEALRSFLEEEECYQIQNAAWNKLYRKDMIQSQRFPVGKWYEDIVYTTRLFVQGKRCVYLDTAFYNYVVDREGSIMNQGINARILTHQIPAYFEKKRVLEELGQEDLIGIHEYYFYKRLLIYYKEIRRTKGSNRGEKKEQLGQLTTWIRESKKCRHRMYLWEGAKASDQKKLDIFLFSPTLYYYVILVNERLLLPIKEKKQAKRN